MSLPAIAQHMSSYGRNGDTMLVHMTPSEVHGLQALAEKHGTTLTINPDTGLPEAFGLKDLVKAAAPVALGALLGPAGMGLASSAMGAGFMVGGVTALATGNLQQGLMAGLGAYGGFGLSEGLAGLGAQELATTAADDALVQQAAEKSAMNASEAALQAAESGASSAVTDATSKAAIDQASFANSLQSGTPTAVSPINAGQVGQTVQTTTQVPSYFDKLGAGFDRATSSGGLDALSAQMKTAGGPSLSGASMATAGSILGSGAFDEKRDLSKAKLDAGYIRPYTYNPFGQKYTARTPIKADEFGSRYMATGGIVALAGGGSLADERLAAFKKFEGGPQGGFTDAQTASYIQNNNLSGQALQDAAKVFHIDQNQLKRANQLIIANDPRIAAASSAYQAQIAENPELDVQNREFYDPSTGTGTGFKGPAGPTPDSYNKMTGGSKAAYDYLMGSGEYPIRPYTPTGEIYKPYAEATMGMKADPTQFQTTFNPETRQYEDNPNYKPYTFDMGTGQETRGMSSTEINKLISDPANLTAEKPETAPAGWIGGLVDKLADNETRPYWMVANNLSYEDLVRATGSSMEEIKKRFPKTTVGADAAAATAAAETAKDVYEPGKAGGLMSLATGGMSSYNLGGYSDGGRLLKGPGDGVSDSIPASIGDKQPARLADGEFVVPARIVSELGNGSTEAGARKLYQMMDRVQKARGKTTGKGKVAANSRSDKYLPA